MFILYFRYCLRRAVIPNEPYCRDETDCKHDVLCVDNECKPQKTNNVIFFRANDMDGLETYNQVQRREHGKTDWYCRTDQDCPHNVHCVAHECISYRQLNQNFENVQTGKLRRNLKSKRSSGEDQPCLSDIDCNSADTPCIEGTCYPNYDSETKETIPNDNGQNPELSYSDSVPTLLPEPEPISPARYHEPDNPISIGHGPNYEPTFPLIIGHKRNDEPIYPMPVIHPFGSRTAHCN